MTRRFYPRCIIKNAAFDIEHLLVAGPAVEHSCAAFRAKFALSAAQMNAVQLTGDLKGAAFDPHGNAKCAGRLRLAFGAMAAIDDDGSLCECELYLAALAAAGLIKFLH